MAYETLIDKDTIMAEIERRIESCAEQRKDMLNLQFYALADDVSARIGELNCIQNFINTLEVKEVDLDDKGEWKNTGGFGSTWDPDSPDYCPD